VGPPAASEEVATVGPPVQRIESATAISTEPLGSVTSVRELRDGRVLVNDGTRRRLILMDSMLTTVGVVLDSVSEIQNTYGPRAGALLPYRGDSLLFVDPAAYAMVVLDPEARFVRVRSIWRVEDASFFTGPITLYGVPGLDAKGRMVYRINARPGPPVGPIPTDMPYLPPTPDSAFIVAVDLETRRQDTIAVLRIPTTERNLRRTPTGGFTIESVTNPLPRTDDWGVLSDGTVAIVRGVDYRIDYLNPDGSWMSSEKLPYPWQRLEDQDKVRLVDSLRVVMQRQAATTFVSSMIRWVNQYGQGYPEGFKVPEGYVPQPGFGRDWILPPGVSFPANYIYACPPGTDPAVALAPAAPGAPAASGGGPSCLPSLVVLSTSGITPAPPTLRQPSLIDPLELPDYRPPFLNGAVRADMDGNLWIRSIPARPIPGGIVYDIVNRAGELTQRLQLPTGYTIVGFGRGRVLYVSMRDANGLHVARVRLR
jgi:hypothetical protein